jgi:predicted site-specific integrase-resolvase
MHAVSDLSAVSATRTTRVLTSREVASLLRVDDCTITRWCREGEADPETARFPCAFRAGRGWRIPEPDVHALMRPDIDLTA